MTNTRNRAENYEDIKPLISMCRQGRLFDVQQWIDEGKPIESPLPELKRARKKGPLEIAIETGFHSLVQVILEAGASIIEDRYNPLEHALRKKRIDIIDLLVKHGADIHSVKMSDVFETWDPEIMRYFIDRGADVETGEPMAGALIDRIRTSLGIYKKYADKFPSFPDQLNTALRWHAREGNEKWVSLLLWAGADPTKPGPCGLFDDDEELYETAIELAFSRNHSHLFKLKGFQIDVHSPRIQEIVQFILWRARGEKLLDLIDEGLDLRKLDSDDFPMIQTLIRRIPNSSDSLYFSYYGGDCLEIIKLIHIVARECVKWTPSEYDLKDARRSFVRNSPDIVAEFVWIMSVYSACSKKDLLELVRTTRISQHIIKHRNRINEMIDRMACE